MEIFKIRSFGRVKSRKLGDIKTNTLEQKLPKYKIDIESDKLKSLMASKKLLMEIGFGYGEHTIHQSLLNKDSQIIACETYINGVLSLVDKIENDKIENINIFNGDARLLLEKIPNNSIDRIFILFPDPWPKKKQNKRRIISDEFLKLIKSKLKINGSLFFASDILDYVNWTYSLAKDVLNPNFNKLEDCKEEPTWWIKTRYQEKAIREGRESYFLEFLNK